LKELHHRCIFERRGVRDVDDHLRARECFRQAISGESIDARVRRGCEYFVAALPKKGDELGADESRATNHYDLHVITPATSIQRRAGS
jgi:hypothetical protein